MKLCQPAKRPRTMHVPLPIPKLQQLHQQPNVTAMRSIPDETPLAPSSEISSSSLLMLASLLGTISDDRRSGLHTRARVHAHTHKRQNRVETKQKATIAFFKTYCPN